MKKYFKPILAAGCFYPLWGWAGAVAGQEHDPVSAVILWVTVIFSLSILGRYIAKRFHQAGVLGELIMGVVVGNLCYYFGVQLFIVLREGSSVFNIISDMLHGMPLGKAVSDSIANPFYAKQITDALSSSHGFEIIKVGYVLDIFSRYGVIFLLFMVGLESSVKDLRQTGSEAVRVAVIGVLAPIILGFVIAHLILPEASYKADLFVAATLSATSIGITARVLAEMKKLRTREARTILGAAMLDDILGLVILAIVSSVVVSGEVDMMTVLQVVVSAALFFIVVLLVGPWILSKSIKLFGLFELWEAKLFVSFVFVMGLAWLATLMQLASIMGAFAAGLILHDGYFETDGKTQKRRFDIKDLVSPFEAILAPLFFMLIGIQVKLETFFDGRVLLMAAGLIVAAIVGKLVSGLGGSKKDNRLLIGIGMLPRGEVGLVFASIGRTLGVINDQLFSAIILMVIVTTFLAPPWLKAQYAKSPKDAQA
ncbi:cation:proton antiporter [Legionella spiritensis]|uniref:Na(+)/H(+) antiporter n=1 Tax=Legionella spiritensis TaxID=452 RepID=A0A0W0YXP5_LEGSP|nr:cation:proton antiporter [Legionella spiritensis]KTD61634.1 Na(+)/H(+) antiporter [Legionella spiritensis]SNV39273.1 Na(+)/H(+) antiporter [Legionella spiritensis]